MSNADFGAFGATLLRTTLGGLFLAHAGLKFFLFTPAGTAQFFESVGLPGGLAYAVLVIETIGGLALILGVYTRLVALALTPILWAPLWQCMPRRVSSSTILKAGGNSRQCGRSRSSFRL
jgi:uncharacterized membrane protein YphA (DoxX/SURF4 family)